MKILFLNTLYAPHIGGGAEIILQEQVAGIERMGHNVVVLTIGPNAGLSQEVIDGIRVYRAGIRNIYFHYASSQPSSWQRILWHTIDIYNPLMKAFIRKVISMENPDIAVCHNLTGWSIAAWVTLKEGGVPIVQVLHDYYLLCPRSTMFNGKKTCVNQCALCRLMRLPHAALSNQVDAVVGVSNFTLNKIISYGYFQDTPIKRVIHNARSFNLSLNEEAHRSPDGKAVFGFIGILTVNKGIEMLLENFTKRAQPHWVLRVAGSGKTEYVQKLKQQFNDPRIDFLGYCSQQQFFSTIDCCIVPSIWEEPFPTVVVESLIFGIPVIGSNSGGIPEMVKNGENGLLFDLAKSDSLADAMEHFVRTLSDWRRKRNLIKQNAVMFTDVEGWIKQYEAMFEKIIK